MKTTSKKGLSVALSVCLIMIMAVAMLSGCGSSGASHAPAPVVTRVVGQVLVQNPGLARITNESAPRVTERAAAQAVGNCSEIPAGYSAISGATIVVSNSSETATTDANGCFSMTLNSNGVSIITATKTNSNHGTTTLKKAIAIRSGVTNEFIAANGQPGAAMTEMTTVAAMIIEKKITNNETNIEPEATEAYVAMIADQEDVQKLKNDIVASAQDPTTPGFTSFSNIDISTITKSEATTNNPIIYNALIAGSPVAQTGGSVTISAKIAAFGTDNSISGATATLTATGVTPITVSLSRTSPEGITYSGSYSFGANTTGNDITYVATIAAADIKNLTGSYATETFQVLQSGAGCGDSTVQAGSGETCDAGAGNTNTACTAAYGQTCNYCDTSCVSHDVVGTRCGDNTVQAGNGEICDDGNTANGDGCSSACQTEDLTPSQAISITLGDDFSCVLFSNGKVACTGSNSSGQLGNGTTRKSLGIAYVSGITSAEQISSGEQATHTCARLSSGAVKCWGANYAGQLGNGTTTNSSTPVSMSGISNAIDVSVGGTNTCVVLQDGTIRCAGTGYTGVATIPDISNAIQVSVMTTSTCALLSGHTVKCWGENSNGTLGNGSTTSSNTPVGVTGISNAVKLMHGGYSHMCALLDDTTAKCWGYNHTSQVGDGTQTNRTTPVVFDAGLSGIVDIAGGQDATCVILSTGQLKCVGYIQEGLGDGTSAYSGTIVTTLVSNAKNAAMSSLKTACAVRNDGTVACWGINNGVFGDLSTNFTSSATPVEMILSDTCGNGIIFPLTEQCDMSAANGTNGLCSATCQSLGGCGNGYIDSGETCDDGNQIDTDSCPNTCIATGCAANTDFDACFNDHVNMCMWMGGSCQAW